jgi:hypothetical protein
MARTWARKATNFKMISFEFILEIFLLLQLHIRSVREPLSHQLFCKEYSVGVLAAPHTPGTGTLMVDIERRLCLIGYFNPDIKLII